MLNNLNIFDPSFNISSFSIITLYVFTFLYMLVNGAINFPSSQIFYITLGYSYSYISYNILIIIIIGSLGNTIGNYIIYRLVYKNDETVLAAIFKYLKIERGTLSIWLNKIKPGSLYLLVFARVLPSVKVLVPLIAGILKISKFSAITIFIVGSMLWSTSLLYVGIIFGKSVSLTNFFILLTLVYIVLAYFISKRKG